MELKATLKTKIFFAVGLFFIPLIIYSGNLSFGFVFDDNVQVLDNFWIRDAGHLKDIFFSSAWAYMKDTPGSNFYRPVMHLVFMAEYSAFGLDPVGFHLVNNILHSFNAVLVFLTASFLFSNELPGPKGWPSLLPAFGAGLLFALHPINTEVVCWVAAVPELTFTGFFLLSFCLYAGSKGISDSKYLLSAVLYFFALLSKETAIVLPAVLFLYDYSRKGLGVFRDLKKYIAYFLIAALYMAMRSYAVGGVMLQSKKIDISLYDTLINIPPLIFRYFSKLIYPAGLKAIYPLDLIHSITDTRVILGMAALLIYIAAIFLSRRNKPLFFSLVWIIIPLLPVMYIPAVSTGGFADRYMYLPSIGFAIALSHAVWLGFFSGNTGGERSYKGRAAGFSVLVLLVFALYAASSLKRSAVWENDYTLWTDTIKNFPDDVQNSETVHFNFAWILQKMGDNENALIHYEKALKQDPGKEKTHNNLAVIYALKGDKEKAIWHYSEVIRLNPGNIYARYNLAVNYQLMGDLKSAIPLYEEAVRIKPDYEDAHYNLAMAYRDSGDRMRAIAHFKRVLELNPSSEDAYFRIKEMDGRVEPAGPDKTR
jgi:tetratricopeptide (TPR) repeat protein